jgi:hypothetical protein
MEKTRLSSFLLIIAGSAATATIGYFIWEYQWKQQKIVEAVADLLGCIQDINSKILANMYSEARKPKADRDYSELGLNIPTLVSTLFKPIALIQLYLPHEFHLHEKKIKKINAHFMKFPDIQTSITTEVAVSNIDVWNTHFTTIYDDLRKSFDHHFKMFRNETVER